MKEENLRESVYAFNNTDIVASYDSDMDIWHPNRAKMASVVCEILPFGRTERLIFLDLGTGTGYLSHRIAETFPHAVIIAVDAAELMIEKAKLRLRNYNNRMTYYVSPFQELSDEKFPLPHPDAVISSLALHHLYKEEKLKLFRYIYSILKAGGWFINCDILKTADPFLETRFRYLHYLGIQQRTMSVKNRETTLEEISSRLAEKEKKDGDHPLFLSEELQLLTEAGFPAAECFWKEYREAVYGGKK
jgi:ubiquinone/menaquinone biosynthesis C-methylase UbiE